MTTEEIKLWQKIDAFTLDEPGIGFSFPNGWPGRMAGAATTPNG